MAAATVRIDTILGDSTHIGDLVAVARVDWDATGVSDYVVGIHSSGAIATPRLFVAK
jgi:hypothetical protein